MFEFIFLVFGILYVIASYIVGVALLIFFLMFFTVQGWIIIFCLIILSILRDMFKKKDTK
ncbi:hypothetical protein BJQ06_18345 [Salmonella enterica subsp. enterica serovar Newport]|nr:hypothetical protein [Salmonella enterica]EAT4615384.1 hypothetical protein [Salmonella enterica]ECU7961792.1 hypothetical protein [Salmonella enterica subsp. enterica serovar Newport]